MLADPQVRAVVVGVTRYQDARIPALRYADRDATYFAEWLQSPAGGNVPPDQVRLLTDEQASYGQMVSAYTWLLENSGKDHLAILYFSGHGDMENQTVMNHGFLLAHDAPAANYMAGGFPIYYLSSIVRTLSTQNQSQVLLIADACRAGKLAGEDFSGTQATLKVLSDQFANEAKLLSCQPNEYSQEDQRWGGGHGVFTWYLVDGLTGLADRNRDQQVTLLEIQRYLEDHVPQAVAPKSQIPIVTGNKGMVISQVDSESLATLRRARGEGEGMGGPQFLDGRIHWPAAEDSLVWAQYRQFGLALQERRLLEPEDNAAYPIYQRIFSHPLLQPYRSAMRLDLSAALQEEAQKAINDYLSASPAELHRRWSFDTSYRRYPEYLATSAEILGENHFLHEELKLKEAYFRGLNLRLAGEISADAGLYLEARQWQEAALKMDSTAAFVLNELGLLARRENRFEESIGHFRKALDYAPTWVLARSNLCGSLVEQERFADAQVECAEALKRDSTFALAHFNLGLAYYKSSRFDEALGSFRQSVHMDPRYYEGWLHLGLTQWRSGQWSGMNISLAMADSLRSGTFVQDNDLFIVGKSYFIRELSEQANHYFEKALERNPLNPELLHWCSKNYIKMHRLPEAQILMERLDSLDALQPEPWPFRNEFRFNHAFLHLETGQYSSALVRFEALSKEFPEDPEFWMGVALCQARLERPAAALEALERAISLGSREAPQFLQETEHLESIRDLPEFKTLLNKIRSED